MSDDLRSACLSNPPTAWCRSGFDTYSICLYKAEVIAINFHPETGYIDITWISTVPDFMTSVTRIEKAAYDCGVFNTSRLEAPFISGFQNNPWMTLHIGDIVVIAHEPKENPEDENPSSLTYIGHSNDAGDNAGVSFPVAMGQYGCYQYNLGANDYVVVGHNSDYVHRVSLDSSNAPPDFIRPLGDTHEYFMDFYVSHYDWVDFDNGFMYSIGVSSGRFRINLQDHPTKWGLGNYPAPVSSSYGTLNLSGFLIADVSDPDNIVVAWDSTTTNYEQVATRNPDGTYTFQTLTSAAKNLSHSTTGNTKWGSYDQYHSHYETFHDGANHYYQKNWWIGKRFYDHFFIDSSRSGSVSFLDMPEHMITGDVYGSSVVNYMSQASSWNSQTDTTRSVDSECNIIGTHMRSPPWIQWGTNDDGNNYDSLQWNMDESVSVKYNGFELGKYRSLIDSDHSGQGPPTISYQGELFAFICLDIPRDIVGWVNIEFDIPMSPDNLENNQYGDIYPKASNDYKLDINITCTFKIRKGGATITLGSFSYVYQMDFEGYVYESEEHMRMFALFGNSGIGFNRAIDNVPNWGANQTIAQDEFGWIGAAQALAPQEETATDGDTFCIPGELPDSEKYAGLASFYPELLTHQDMLASHYVEGTESDSSSTGRSSVVIFTDWTEEDSRRHTTDTAVEHYFDAFSNIAGFAGTRTTWNGIDVIGDCKIANTNCGRGVFITVNDPETGARRTFVVVDGVLKGSDVDLATFDYI